MLWLSPALRGNDESASTMPPAKLIDQTPLTPAELFTALLPWIILCAILLIWGTGWFKAAVNPIFTWNYAVPELHNMINKVAPVVAEADAGRRGVRRSPMCRSPERAC